MMKSEEKFKVLCACMLEMDHVVLGSADFEMLCLEHGADVCAMDNMMYETFGMSGEEVVRQLGYAENHSFLSKLNRFY